MALIELQANFASLVAVLTRIADALDRAYPMIMIPYDTKPRGKESLSKIGPKDRWLKEQQKKQKIQDELEQ